MLIFMTNAHLKLESIFSCQFFNLMGFYLGTASYNLTFEISYTFHPH